ncbi:MAG: hypothetical protein MUO34_13280, partial [Ignavibacteriaceae bacterium]|nr:hypothetical protein [Ignavibacteriaceae bacterium]
FAQDFPQDLINSIQYLVQNGTPIYLIKFDYYEHTEKGLFLLVENLTGKDNELFETEEENPKTKVIFLFELLFFILYRILSIT